MSDSPPEAPDGYVLRLFIAGTAARSLRAVEALRRICENRLGGRCDLEIVDVYQQPELAERDGVFAAPTVLRVFPLPQRRVTGDLLDEGRVARGLDLPAPAGAAR